MLGTLTLNTGTFTLVYVAELSCKAQNNLIWLCTSAGIILATDCILYVHDQVPGMRGNLCRQFDAT